MRILANKDEISRAQREFEEVVVKAASERIETRIGYPAGQRKAFVHWVPKTDLWANISLPSDVNYPAQRYWNVFGFGKPTASNPVNIMCEINPPFEGIDRRSAGAFGQAEGNFYILHRGRFTAYRGGIPKRFIRAEFRGSWHSVRDGDRDSQLLVVGRLRDSNFVDDLRKFVAEAVRVRGLYKAR